MSVVFICLSAASDRWHILGVDYILCSFIITVVIFK